ncbi:MAG: signal peptidase I [Clostridia bacterium]|nr:signal peptidase I [Clostridia bacterium]
MADNKETIQTQNEITDTPLEEKPKRKRAPRTRKVAEAPKTEEPEAEVPETKAPEAEASDETVAKEASTDSDENVTEEAVPEEVAPTDEVADFAAEEAVPEEVTPSEEASDAAAEEAMPEEGESVTDEFSHIPTALLLDGDGECEEAPTDATDTTDEDAGECETDSPEQTESAPIEEDEGGFLIVEHFADYEKKNPTEPEAEDDGEEVETGDTPEDADEAGVPTEDYENLTILDTVSEDKPRERIKNKHVTGRDDAPFSAEKQRGVDNRFDIIELFVFTLTVILIITTFFFKHSVVQGSSMVDTLHDGDHLIISDFMYEPKQYDIVVVHDPEAYANGPMVKRVIALGGQRVRLERRLVAERSTASAPFYKTTVYVDGTPVRDDFIYQSGSDDIRIDFVSEDFEIIAADLTNGEFYIFEYTVPEGEIFVLGDHRNNSTDSREFGSLSEETVLGRALIRIFPFSDFGAIED